MITKEVNDWVKKVECGMYCDVDLVYEFSRISKYLTKEELIFIKKKLANSVGSKLKFF